MPTQTLLKWFARQPSAAPQPPESPAKPRERLRVGIPRVLNLWSTHQFWIGFFAALGIDARRLEFSSDSSEDQARQFGKGRGTALRDADGGILSLIQMRLPSQPW